MASFQGRRTCRDSAAGPLGWDWAVFLPATSLDALRGPAPHGYVDEIAFRVPDDLFCFRTVDVILGFGLGSLLDLADAADLKTEVVDAGRLRPVVDQREAKIAIGKIDTSVRAPARFFHAEHFFVVVGELLALSSRHPYRDVSYFWPFHGPSSSPRNVLLRSRMKL